MRIHHDAPTLVLKKRRGEVTRGGENSGRQRGSREKQEASNGLGVPPSSLAAEKAAWDYQSLFLVDSFAFWQVWPLCTERPVLRVRMARIQERVGHRGLRY